MRAFLISSVMVIALAGCGKPAEADQVPADTAATPVRYQIDKVGLPGEGRGDYIVADGDARRLYVTHTTVIHILDLDTLEPIGAVEGLEKAAGVAFAAGKGFASDAEGDAIVVFDPASGKTRKVIPGRDKPDSILFDQPSGMIFVFNGESKDISIIDPVKEAIVKTISVNDTPEYSRSDGKGKVYFNMEDDHAIGVIDTRAATISKKIVLPDCEGPAALGIDEANDRLFSSCGNGEMKVVDAASGKVVAEIPVGEDPDGIVYDPHNKRIIVAARDGNWTIVDQQDPDTYAVNQVLKIDAYAKTLGFDPRSGRIFSSTADLVWPREVPGKRLLPDAKSGSFRLMVVSAK